MVHKGSRGVQQPPRRRDLEAALTEQRIVSPHPGEVVAYLATHRNLAKIVPLVCEQARRAFGQEAELIMEVYRDPEIDDRHLTLYVRLLSYENNAIIERMDRVTQPYEDQLCIASGYLLVTTDFRPPGAAHGI